MKLTTKILIPAAFALATSAASAGVFNLEYPANRIAENTIEQGAMVGIGGSLKISNSQAPVKAKQFQESDLSREQVLRKAERNPLEFDDTRYFQ